MPRVLGLLLLGLGIVLGTIGFIGTIIAIQGLARGGGVPLLVAFVVIDGVGLALVIVGILLLRRARIAAAIPPVSSGVISYRPHEPMTQEMDGSPYTVLYTPPVRGKHPRPSTLQISTPAATNGQFHMAPETWFDRYFTRIGLAVELQTGDETFDEECYIRSDTPAFTAAYLTDPVKRVAILDLRRLGFPEVILEGGTVSATWIGFDPVRNDQPEMAAETAARLILLARNLPEHQPEFDQRVGGRRVRWQIASWLFLLAFAVSLLSLIAFPPADGLDLLFPSLIVLGLGLLVFALTTAWLLSGTSTSHYAWGGLMIGALILFPAGSPGIVTLANGILDSSGPTTHHAEIIDKYTTRSKNKTKYHVLCDSWSEPGKRISFSISQNEYNAIVQNQSKLAVTTHSGSLGIEWIESKRVEVKPGKG